MRIRKSYIAAAHDILMAAASFVLSLNLRLGDNFDQSEPYLLSGLVVFTGVCAVCFFAFGLHRRMWSYVSMQDVAQIVKAVTLAILIFLPFMFMLNRLDGFPRSMIAINWFVLLALLSGPRLLYRMIKEQTFNLKLGHLQKENARKIPIILAGLNDHTELFLRETQIRPDSEYSVIGILDDDLGKHGRHIRNVKVFGGLKDLERAAIKLKKAGRQPQKIIYAPGYTEGEEISSLLDSADRLGLTMGRLPRLSEFKTSIEDKIEIKPIAVEDLLGRAQASLNRDKMRAMIAGKNILITGAGGTIGSELARQAASYAPKSLTLFEISEHNLYLIDKELEEKYPKLERRPVIGDVRERKKLDAIFKNSRPEIVFHAAALKHVPMSERNISETVITNLIGTKNTADACVAARVKHMIMVSTDKAVNPANIMGATKRAAESYVQALGQSKKSGATIFTTVRFGNVLGSTGSVIPLFKRQLEEGGPLTVTHPDMVRFFMTVREAVELILQASVIGNEEKENGAIFVLEMGKPVHIKDLAMQMIRLAGLKPDEDIKIEYTGLRPGEKLYEELFHDGENPHKTKYESILITAAREVSLKEVDALVKKLHHAAQSFDDGKIIPLIKKLVPEFSRS